jgi:hypothetical protein
MKNLLATLIILFLFSCGEKLLKTPEDLIPKEKMIDILSDLAILNAAKNSNADILRDHNIEPTKFVFEKYEVDSLQFVTSDVYYASLPKEYEAMYLEIEAFLEKEKGRITEEKRISDSLLLESNLKNRPQKRDKSKANDSLP